MMRRRSFATLAVFFGPGRRKSNSPIGSASEDAGEDALLLDLGEAHRAALAEQPPDRVLVGLAGLRALVEDDRHALVRGLQHDRRLRDHAQYFQAQDLLH